MSAASASVEAQDGADAQRLLASLISLNAHQFLRPTREMQQAAVLAAKAFLDPLANDVAETQLVRRDVNRKKRKRGEVEDGNEEQRLQLREVYTKGFGVRQVYEQARRVLDAANREVEHEIEEHNALSATKVHGRSDEDTDAIDADRSISGLATEDPPSSDEDDEYAETGSPADVDQSGEEEMDDADLDTPIGLDEEDIEADSDAEHTNGEYQKTQETYIPDPNGLNDGFFSIDDFNTQTQLLEQVDARGDDDNPSDEDEVDWDADPLAQQAAKSRRYLHNMDEASNSADDDDDEEQGPTFGNADLDASASDGDQASDVEQQKGLDDIMGISNANEIRYADFFQPPAQKPSKKKRMRALPKTQPSLDLQDLKEHNDANLQSDIERAIADVRRDLLDSDEDEDDDGSPDLSSEEDDQNRAASRPKSRKAVNLSTHERQRAEIAAQIRELEAAAVAKREWQLSGEASAVARPVNSLIEEDLEFERAGKPVPVVMAETSTTIEDLIKQRILAREFDEVIRRLPGGLGDASQTRRGRVEVDDRRPEQSLAEVYESAHQKAHDPNYVDQRDAKTKKQHEEIDTLWREVNDQLNILSNLNFKPKRIEVEMKTVEDKPRIMMEDARPVGDLESGEGGMLAPQEVYRPGGRVSGSGPHANEVTTTGGTSLAREEMTREEKLRRRRREKERNKKAAGNRVLNVLGKTPGRGENSSRPNSLAATQKDEQNNIMQDLKRGGVQIVNKSGELQSVGQKSGHGRNADRTIRGSALKL